MSSINALNSIQQQFTDLVSTDSSNTSSVSGGKSFEKALDVAMNAKDIILPPPVSSAIDAGASLLGGGGVLSNATDVSSIKDGLEGIFNELSVGIASSFIAALAGADSATALASTTTSTDTEAKTKTEADASNDKVALISTENVSDQKAIVTKQSVAATKSLFDGIAPYLSDNKTVPLASSALSALQDVLLGTDKNKEKES